MPYNWKYCSLYPNNFGASALPKKMDYGRSMPPTMSFPVHGEAHGVCPPRMNGVNSKSIVFGHGLTTTTKQVLQDTWLRARVAMLHSFCQQQVVVMPTKLTKKEYTVTTGRVRCSPTILLTVAQPTSYNFFRLLSNPIGTTHAIMVLLCVVCVLPQQQRVQAAHNQIAP